jgi:hypothetical protein
MQVFDFLDQHDLAQCQLVCTSWCPHAQIELYKEIDFSSFREGEITKFYKTVSSIYSHGSIQPGALVKKFNLHDVYTDLHT